LERFAASKSSNQVGQGDRDVSKPQEIQSSQTTTTTRPARKVHSSPFVKHATFTHCQLADFDIANGLNAIVGAFFNQSGPAGAYKALEWLEFKAPDAKGEGRFVNELDDLAEEDGNCARHHHQSSLSFKNSIDSDSSIGVMFKQLEAVEKVIQYK
jgi:hypothetical protein